VAGRRRAWLPLDPDFLLPLIAIGERLYRA
jgi:hypothetical protein